MPVDIREHHYTRSQQPVRSRFEGYQTVAWTRGMSEPLLDQLDRLSVYTFESESRGAQIPAYGYYPLAGGAAALTCVEITGEADATGRADVQYARSVVLDEKSLEEMDYDVFGFLLECPDVFSPRPSSYPGVFEPRQVSWTPGVIERPPCAESNLARLIDALLDRQENQRLHLVTERPEDALPILRAAWIALPRASVKQIRLRSPVDQPNNYTVDWNLITLLRNRLPASLEGKLIVDVTAIVPGTPSNYALQAAAAVFAEHTELAVAARQRLDGIEAPVPSAVVNSAHAPLDNIEKLVGNNTSAAFLACCRELLALRERGVSGPWLIDRGSRLLELAEAHHLGALADLAPLSDLDIEFKERWEAKCKELAPPPPAAPMSQAPAALSERAAEQVKMSEPTNQESGAQTISEVSMPFYRTADSMKKELQRVWNLSGEERLPALRQFAERLDPSGLDSVPAREIGSAFDSRLGSLGPDQWQKYWSNFLKLIADTQAKKYGVSRVALDIAAFLMKEYWSTKSSSLNVQHRAQCVPALVASTIAGEKTSISEHDRLWESLPSSTGDRVNFVKMVLTRLLEDQASHSAGVLNLLVIEVLNEVRTPTFRWQSLFGLASPTTAQRQADLIEMTKKYLGAQPSCYVPGQFLEISQKALQHRPLHPRALEFLTKVYDGSISTPPKRLCDSELFISHSLICAAMGQSIEGQKAEALIGHVKGYAGAPDARSSAAMLWTLTDLAATRNRRFSTAIYVAIVAHLSNAGLNNAEDRLLAYTSSLNPADPKLIEVFCAIARLPALQQHVPAVLRHLQGKWKHQLDLEAIGKAVITRMYALWPADDTDGYWRVLSDIRDSLRQSRKVAPGEVR